MALSSKPSRTCQSTSTIRRCWACRPGRADRALPDHALQHGTGRHPDPRFPLYPKFRLAYGTPCTRPWRRGLYQVRHERHRGQVDSGRVARISPHKSWSAGGHAPVWRRATSHHGRADVGQLHVFHQSGVAGGRGSRREDGAAPRRPACSDARWRGAHLWLPAGFKRASELNPTSPAWGLDLCLGCCSEMPGGPRTFAR